MVRNKQAEVKRNDHEGLRKIILNGKAKAKGNWMFSTYH